MDVIRQAYDMIPRMEIGDVLYIDYACELHIKDHVPPNACEIVRYRDKKSSPVASIDDIATIINAWITRQRYVYYDDNGSELCAGCAIGTCSSRPLEPGENILCVQCSCVI